MDIRLDSLLIFLYSIYVYSTTIVSQFSTHQILFNIGVIGVLRQLSFGISDYIDTSIDSTHSELQNRYFVKKRPSIFNLCSMISVHLFTYYAYGIHTPFHNFLFTLTCFYSSIIKLIPFLKGFFTAFFLTYPAVYTTQEINVEFLLYIFVFCFRYEIIKDMFDADNDKKRGIITFGNTFHHMKLQYFLFYSSLLLSAFSSWPYRVCYLLQSLDQIGNVNYLEYMRKISKRMFLLGLMGLHFSHTVT